MNNTMTTITVQVPTPVLTEVEQAREAEQAATTAFLEDVTPGRLRELAATRRALAEAYAHLHEHLYGTPFAAPLVHAFVLQDRCAREDDRAADRLSGGAR
ncbi:hypothetical protein [Allokutzneria oryzae]|uniref:Uncharacterized protein n=1 Tax=Allokutzneria oryzae TaxID=1378989 RepID=A0ABV6A0T2_9PSEU